MPQEGREAGRRDKRRLLSHDFKHASLSPILQASSGRCVTNHRQLLPVPTGASLCSVLTRLRHILGSVGSKSAGCYVRAGIWAPRNIIITGDDFTEERKDGQHQGNLRFCLLFCHSQHQVLSRE